MTLSTGEDLPKGQSLLGRLLILELTRADVDTQPLTRLQKAADEGLLAMSNGYARTSTRLKKPFPSPSRWCAMTPSATVSHPPIPVPRHLHF